MLHTLKLLLGLSLLFVFGFAENNNKISCMDNNASACYLYALPLLVGDNANVQDIREEGLTYIRKACILGLPKACDVLGENYYKDKNYRASKPYLEDACNRGNKVACESIAVMYRDAHDVQQNDVKAREYFSKACTLKSGNACYNMAIIYRGGFAVTKSREKEKEFYKKGCDVGLKAGCIRFTELDNEDKGIETGLWADIKAFIKQ